MKGRDYNIGAKLVFLRRIHIIGIGPTTKNTSISLTFWHFICHRMSLRWHCDERKMAFMSDSILEAFLQTLFISVQCSMFEPLKVGLTFTVCQSSWTFLWNFADVKLFNFSEENTLKCKNNHNRRGLLISIWNILRTVVLDKKKTQILYETAYIESGLAFKSSNLTMEKPLLSFFKTIRTEIQALSSAN